MILLAKSNFSQRLLFSLDWVLIYQLFRYLRDFCLFVCLFAMSQMIYSAAEAHCPTSTCCIVASSYFTTKRPYHPPVLSSRMQSRWPVIIFFVLLLLPTPSLGSPVGGCFLGFGKWCHPRPMLTTTTPTTRTTMTMTMTMTTTTTTTTTATTTTTTTTTTATATATATAIATTPDNSHHHAGHASEEADGNRRPTGGFRTTAPNKSDDNIVDDNDNGTEAAAEPPSMDSTASLASFSQRIAFVNHIDVNDDESTEDSSDDEQDDSAPMPCPSSAVGPPSLESRSRSRSLSFSTMDLRSLRKSSWTADHPSPRSILRESSGDHEAWRAKWRSAHSKLAGLSRDLKKWEEARGKLSGAQPVTQRYYVCEAEVHMYARKMLCMLRVLENHARKLRAHGQVEQADAWLKEFLPQPDKYRERLQHLFDHTKFPTARSWVELSENSRRFNALLDSVRAVLCPDSGVPTMTSTSDADYDQQARPNALTALAEASYRLERLERDLKYLQRIEETTVAVDMTAAVPDAELESDLEFWRYQVDTMLDGKWCPKEKPSFRRIEENAYGLGAFDIGKSYSAPASAPLPTSSGNCNHSQRPPNRRYYVVPSGEVWSK